MKTFEDAREEASSFMLELKENPIKKYCEEVNLHDTFFYRYEDFYGRHKGKTKLIITTNIPGIWIGYQGKGVKRLEEILREAFKCDISVAFEQNEGIPIVI